MAHRAPARRFAGDKNDVGMSPPSFLLVHRSLRSRLRLGGRVWRASSTVVPRNAEAGSTARAQLIPFVGD